MPPKISVVMTGYKRAPQLNLTLDSIYRQDTSDVEVILVEDGDDGGAMRAVCAAYPQVIYMQRARRPDVFYSNPAIPNNMGLRAATGDIVILQNAECMHVGETIRRLTSRVNETNAVFAQVDAVDWNGFHLMWYVHQQYSRRPFFFCGAMLRKHFVELRGFDQDFVHYGYDDNDFADRLLRHGITFEFTDVEVKHQWHPCGYDPKLPNDSARLYSQKKKMMAEGIIGVVRNDENWGLDPDVAPAPSTEAIVKPIRLRNTPRIVRMPESR